MNKRNKLTFEDRQEAKAEILEAGELYCRALMVDPQFGCMPYATIGTAILRQKYSQKALVQAGSVTWQANDNPEGNNAYGYVFDLEAARAHVEAGEVPEVHAWIGYPDPGGSKHSWLVDPTTQYFRERSENELGIEWTTPDPPACLWSNRPAGPGDIHRFYYKPDKNAVSYATNTMKLLHAKAEGAAVAMLTTIVEDVCKIKVVSENYNLRPDPALERHVRLEEAKANAAKTRRRRRVVKRKRKSR